MVNISVLLPYVLDIFAFKRVNAVAGLIFTGREFHNKIDDVKKVLIYPLLFSCCTWGSLVLCDHYARIVLMYHLQEQTYCINILGIARLGI